MLPCVAAEHAPFKGFAAGDVINDHDLALFYVLEHYGALLPSFVSLPAEQQRSVAFTQCNMSFNQKWLLRLAF